MEFAVQTRKPFLQLADKWEWNATSRQRKPRTNYPSGCHSLKSSDRITPSLPASLFRKSTIALRGPEAQNFLRIFRFRRKHDSVSRTRKRFYCNRNFPENCITIVAIFEFRFASNISPVARFFLGNCCDEVRPDGYARYREVGHLHLGILSKTFSIPIPLAAFTITQCSLRLLQQATIFP